MDTLSICFTINREHEENLSLEEYKSFFHGNIYEVIEAGKKKLIPNYDEIYEERTRELIVPEELKNLIKKIDKEKKLAIVSSTPGSTIRDILEREGIATYFSDFFGSDVDRSKVVKIKMLLEKYKVSPDDAVFITDTVGDIMEARECGVESIAVTWGFHEEKTLQKAKPEKIVSTPEDLLKAIQEI